MYNNFLKSLPLLWRYLSIAVLGLAIVGVLAAGVSAETVEITGVPGSPSATTTIDGKQLPPPPDKHFGGKIERNAMDSTPYWPPRVVPPKGAPNILLIMTDDAGYGVSSTFGGVIPTPAMDRIAENGLRYTHFHSTSVCSPTRAALITGRNHHQVGTGSIPELSTGYPGYNSHHDQGQCDDCQNPQGPRLRDLLVRQESQYAGSPGQQDRAL